MLQDCGRGNVLAEIAYQKPGEKWVTHRHVEPYQFTYSAAALIVLTWQCDPALGEPCWRNFRLDRITRASPTTKPFRPRQRVTLHLGEVKRFVMNDDPADGGSAPSVVSPQQLYAQALRNALDDFDLSDQELCEFRAFHTTLHHPQIRAIHGRVYADFLTDICADGAVTDEEQDNLVALRTWMTELGWAP